MIHRATRSGSRRGFSLIEMLMAIFILAIGVISIAALLPAGIHQQKRAFDDTVGPIVANNALALIRSRVTQEDFGSIEEFTPWSLAANNVYATDPKFTVWGDWGWRRPMFIFEDVDPADDLNEEGAIDIFGWHEWNGAGVSSAREVNPVNAPNMHGIPFRFNPSFDPANAVEPPRAVITREERWYPQGLPAYYRTALGTPAETTSYTWECMFRKYQGHVYVAVFVYSVRRAGGEDTRQYTVLPNPSEPTVPPLPIRLDLEAANATWNAGGGTLTDPVLGSSCMEYDVTNDAMSWQEPAQWLLDQNNNIHRVLSADCDDSISPNRRIELTSPVGPRLPVSVEYSIGPGSFNGVVTDLWYMPRIQRGDGGSPEYMITPVYVLVKEL